MWEALHCTFFNTYGVIREMDKSGLLLYYFRNLYNLLHPSQEEVLSVHLSKAYGLGKDYEYHPTRRVVDLLASNLQASVPIHLFVHCTRNNCPHPSCRN